MLCCIAPCWAAPCCAVPRRGVPLCAVSRCVVLWRVVLWGALSCCFALWCAAVRCAVLPRVVPWWVSGGQAGPCRGAECGAERGWLVAGGCGQVARSLGPCCGGLGVPVRPVDRVRVHGVALPGGLCRGPVSSGGPGPWPWALWPCLRPLPVPVRWPLWWPGSSPGGEGVVVGCAAVFPVGSSVGAARSPRAGVPSLPCLVSGGWWACAGVIRMASDSRFGGMCWGRPSPGVVRRPLGVGGAGPSVVVCPSCGWVLVPAAMSSFLRPSPCSLPFLTLRWFPAPTLCRSQCPVPMGACLSPWALPCPLAGVSLSAPCPPLARALSLPGVVVAAWGGGRRWPRPGGG